MYLRYVCPRKLNVENFHLLHSASKYTGRNGSHHLLPQQNSETKKYAPRKLSKCQYFGQKLSFVFLTISTVQR